MKTSIVNTKVTVRLRKSTYANEWYLYIEAYPVYEAGKKGAQRKREYINRIITTPIWDKSRTARTTESGKTYKPKRDTNGIIQCKSDADKETCIYADNIRKILQHQYDNAALYSDKELEQAKQNERSQCDFIEYFDKITIDKHKTSSDSTITNWTRVGELLKIFASNDAILFSQINLKLIEEFRQWILTIPCGGYKKGTISQNTAVTYFNIFKAALKQAFIDEYLTIDLSAKTKSIKKEENRREHLSMEELNTLAATPCDSQVLKRAALFSSLTGLRHCDIKKLQWSEILKVGDTYRIDFTQKKTNGVEYMPISEQAYQLCGEPKEASKLVFEGLQPATDISIPLRRWIKAAGITRNITFHCFRHTYATLQLAGGTDIYTVSKMLGHSSIQNTQIYAKIVDEKKVKATDAIKIETLNLNK